MVCVFVSGRYVMEAERQFACIAPADSHVTDFDGAACANRGWCRRAPIAWQEGASSEAVSSGGGQDAGARTRDSPTATASPPGTAPVDGGQPVRERQPQPLSIEPCQQPAVP